MNARAKRRLSASVLILGALSACGKKTEEPARAPDLTMPAPAPPADAFKAEREVSASKGAVKLTLRLYKTRVPAGDTLWVQIELGDIGKAPLFVVDDPFLDSSPIPVSERRVVNGVAVQVFDDRGHRLAYSPPWTCDQLTYERPARIPLWRRMLALAVSPERSKSLLKPEEAIQTRKSAAKIQGLRKGWEGQGMPRGEIDRKAVVAMRQEANNASDAADSAANSRGRWLAPDESARTVPFAYGETRDCDHPYKPGIPVGPYSGIPVTGFGLEPGRHYQMQAVYDASSFRRWALAERTEVSKAARRGRLSDGERASREKRIDAELAAAVRITTPRIEFEIPR